MVRMVFSTFPDAETAEKIGRLLVEEGLAACVTVTGQCRSIYKWKNEVQDHKEVLAIIKTHNDRLEEMLEKLHQHHPYDVPESLVVKAGCGFEKYYQWIEEVTDPDK
ncbi:MAG TPA: divalent-cation tolerance protein CutA [Euryarchaeota archaeon]|nr:divalent-cation tolerance protein CutA [Euryarchaeota archaeon]